jgi:NAD(P)-dependent dehydrogenase (short-subunit alcohol dehydrogenase family)
VSQTADLPYAVTKGQAVTIAEWLASTYGQHGVNVSVLCPLVSLSFLIRHIAFRSTGERDCLVLNTPAQRSKLADALIVGSLRLYLVLYVERVCLSVCVALCVRVCPL